MSLRNPISFIVAVCLSLTVVGQSYAQALMGFPDNPGGAFDGIPEDPGNLSLVISQTQENHEAIAVLLEQMRRLQGAQVVIETPFHTINDNWFERLGVDFDFTLRTNGTNVVGLDPIGNPTPNGNIDFNQGSFGSSIPPFGGHDAATDATLGFGILKNGSGAFFNFAAGQGNSRSNVTQAPVVVMQDGQTGTVSDTSMRPFVTSVVPVVGGFRGGTLPLPIFAPPKYVSPLRDTIRRYKQQQQEQQRVARSGAPGAMLNPPQKIVAQPNLPRETKVALKLQATRGSSAGQGDLSLAEIRRRKAALDKAKDEAKQQEVLALIEQARGAEDIGKPSLAVIYYQQAASRASGDQKQELIQKIRDLKN